MRSGLLYLFLIIIFVFVCENIAEFDNSTTTTTTLSPINGTTTTSLEEKLELGAKAAEVGLPEPGSEEKEHQYSLTIFSLLMMLIMCIASFSYAEKYNFNFVPESITVICIGAGCGVLLNQTGLNVEEAFPPNIFFIVLLPPIIFESGFNMCKGDFFENIGSIVVFAVFGTLISALVVGVGLFTLGELDLVYRLGFVASFSFGSLISAVDPVATLAIFKSIGVDRVLYMLIFGESILNDAIAIVLTKVAVSLADPANASLSGMEMLQHFTVTFILMFAGSALIGILFGLASSLFLKSIDLRDNPQMEVAFMLIAAYLPYGFCEGVHLSGIMAILSAGIIMAHYSYANLSVLGRSAYENTLRAISYMAETTVFLYLGMAIFSYQHLIHFELMIWTLVLIVLGRALNIFPLAFIVNFFRPHKITRKMQFLMWFSGLRGAVAFAIALNLEHFTLETHRIIVSTTLFICIFSIVVFGGLTAPMLDYLNTDSGGLNISKTREMADAIDTAYTTDDEWTSQRPAAPRGFAHLDETYLKPFFIRRVTRNDLKEAKRQVARFTREWYQTHREVVSGDEDHIGDSSA